jgi:general secretion pathway protein G
LFCPQCIAARPLSTRGPRAGPWRRPSGVRAFTLIELLVALAILVVLLSVAVPAYRQYQLRVKNTTAASDISTMQGHIERFYSAYGRFPTSLQEPGLDGFRDPWGRPYEYLNTTIAENKGKGRKDKNLVPINGDYDLYSMGPDGESAAPLTATKSRDDIVRANNGAYIGLASDY